MKMPCICVKEARKRSRTKIEGIELTRTVSNLKEKTAEKIQIPPQEQVLVFAGHILKDDKTLEDCGLGDGVTVHVLRKEPPAPVPDPDPDLSIDNLLPILRGAVRNPVYRNTVSRILSNPEMLDQLVVVTPALSSDPVALSLLQDPILLNFLIESPHENIQRAVRDHPSLLQAASYIAAAIAKDGAEMPTVLRQNSNDETDPLFGDISDDEEMDTAEPQLIAQAEMIAAREEGIQNSHASGSSAARQPITSSLLASALATATSQVAQASQAGPSTAGNSSRSNPTPGTIPLRHPGPASRPAIRQPITQDLFAQALASAMAPSSSSSNQTNPPSQLQSQLEQLRAMGITDDVLSTRALTVTGGNVQAALDLIFGGFD